MGFNKELVNVALEELLGEEIGYTIVCIRGGYSFSLVGDCFSTDGLYFIDKSFGYGNPPCEKNTIRKITKYKDVDKGTIITTKSGDTYKAYNELVLKKQYELCSQKTHSLLDLVSKEIVDTSQFGNTLRIKTICASYTITGYGFYPDTKLSKKSFEGQVIESVHCELKDNGSVFINIQTTDDAIYIHTTKGGVSVEKTTYIWNNTVSVGIINIDFRKDADKQEPKKVAPFYRVFEEKEDKNDKDNGDTKDNKDMPKTDKNAETKENNLYKTRRLSDLAYKIGKDALYQKESDKIKEYFGDWCYSAKIGYYPSHFSFKESICKTFKKKEKIYKKEYFSVKNRENSDVVHTFCIRDKFFLVDKDRLLICDTENGHVDKEYDFNEFYVD